MTDDPITITLTSEQERAHQSWLAKKDLRRTNGEAWQQVYAELMHPDNSTVIPAAGVWVVHGAVDHANFDDEAAAAAADWPSELIREQCPPVPLIGWRVTNRPVKQYANRVEPMMVLPDGEYEQGLTDVAWGSTPQEAIDEARRLLRADRTKWTTLEQKCADSQHRQVNVRQDSIDTCLCTHRRVKIVTEG